MFLSPGVLHVQKLEMLSSEFQVAMHINMHDTSHCCTVQNACAMDLDFIEKFVDEGVRCADAQAEDAAVKVPSCNARQHLLAQCKANQPKAEETSPHLGKLAQMQTN